MTRSVYLLPEWVELMERWTGARARRSELTGEHGGTLRVVVYQRRDGIFQPPYMPYVGLEFEPTPTTQPARITRQWHQLAAQWLAELRTAGWRRWLTLPPEVTDVRPFAWDGVVVTPRYTYYLPTQAPTTAGAASPEIARKARKAAAAGYTAVRNDDWEAALSNIASTEKRQEFQYALSRTQLQEAIAALGPERCRLYNAYDNQRQPACSIIVLHTPGAVIQDWIAATAAAHLKSGVTQLTRTVLFEDLKSLAAPAFDFCGANIPPVAAAKAEFGPVLMPYYLIEPLGIRHLTRRVCDWWRSR